MLLLLLLVLAANAVPCAPSLSQPAIAAACLALWLTEQDSRMAGTAMPTATGFAPWLWHSQQCVTAAQ
jgi:hypothetical protein